MQHGIHILPAQADAAAGAGFGAVQEDGAAPVRDHVGRAVELDHAGPGVLGRVVLQVLHVVAPGEQLRIVPLLPGVEIGRLFIADPVGVGGHLPPGKLQIFGRRLVPEGRPDGPESRGGAVAVPPPVMHDPVFPNEALQPVQPGDRVKGPVRAPFIADRQRCDAVRGLG